MALANDFNEIKALKSHDEVKTLQTYLKNKGYDIGKAGVDGWYGKKTKAALMKFQQDNGLKVDGIVGDQTIKAMNGKPPSNTLPENPKPAVSTSKSITPTTTSTTTGNPKIKPKTTTSTSSSKNVDISDVTKLSDDDLYKALDQYTDVNSKENISLEKELIKRSQKATADKKKTQPVKTKSIDELTAEVERENQYRQKSAQGRSVGVLKNNTGFKPLSEAFDAGDRSNPNKDVFTNKNTRSNIQTNARNITEGNKIKTVLEKGGTSSSYNPKSGGTDYWNYRKVKLNNGKILFQKVNSLGTVKNINESEYTNSKGKKK